ncbi:tRNA pseudouridine synthase A [Campylobacter hyointestinalis]|uniref:tRNA pseudouridine synthase A n=1 Tax=Campylobacter hyointestinalis TaxID=198 RepID=UPI0004D6B44F|nr:tRNA pseudouridine synthase A [Campylobacter hyointestinalis]KEA44972.1 pseudouridine synthase [Campylobacter hyointestinalis subsp. hyointestinalis]QKF55868.1 tRNA pseudouridine(38-40) synthase [Campylobacter hyointestinalis subsp. hyointestinalis]TXK48305.1 tRNA pseudouridine synthase A [Campylobacter hyointestinalis]SFT36516.1 tRNA pseudouridine38-40 synthase [Campylobacter hyointestinalis]SUW90628.1 tRNA pseudouridine synthase A [Campylobacter hyointestinalis]
MKITLIYSYDGSKFSGSQSQPNLLSVEDKLNSALKRVGIFERIVSSSRTDKGVHSLAQVSSVECGEFWKDRLKWLKKELNKHSAPYIFIKQLYEVSSDFHPRFFAKARSYRYILHHGKFNPFLSDYVCFYDELHLDRLNKALEYFLGRHDFKPFYKVGSGEKSTIREIYLAKAYQIYKDKFGKIKRIKSSFPLHQSTISTQNLNTKPTFTIINFKANGFLRAQVRLMVANALQACKSDESLAKFISNFKEQKPITRMPSPPNGLYLKRVFY